MPIHTDRTIAANRPDIVLKNKKDKTCLLIDMTILLDTNTSVKMTEKLNKIQRLGNQVIRGLEEGDRYKYMYQGILEADDVRHNDMKQSISNEY
ncbi:unnamed protein product, partial [Porites evermanni]